LKKEGNEESIFWSFVQTAQAELDIDALDVIKRKQEIEEEMLERSNSQKVEEDESLINDTVTFEEFPW
jgi:hypothetical protein